MASYKVSYEFQVTDINGDVANVVVHAFSADSATLAQIATNVATLDAALAAATNGKVTRQGASVLVNEAQFLVGSTPPTNAEYSSVTDGARFQFANGGGDRASSTIPAPLEAMFGSNSNVIDSTQTQAAAWIAAFESIARGNDGSPLNLYKGGIKVGRRARRRRSALVP